ncbi:DUF4153 domain-containing protein [Rhodobacter xanthinilyticus]|nr:DUF4153 domain-containing protein [Rhodobacter xanthinilyticus]
MFVKRLHFTALGAAAGASAWGVWEISDRVDGERLVLGLAVLAACFFFAALSMLRELGIWRALVAAAGLGVLVSGLSLLKSLGFSSVREMFEAGHVAVALTVLGAMPVPFLIAALARETAGWRDYRVLFVESWTVLVRYAAATMFLGMIWVVIFLGDGMLRLVGVDLVETLFSEDLVVAVFNGAVLGLGLAVVSELSDLVSPYLLLRLLRLLTPVALGLVGVFLLMLPLRGLDQLFGSISAAGVLLAMAVVAVSLVTIAVDQDDVEAAHGPVVSWAARGLAVVVPVLAVIAGWAILERVGQYGWTPARVAAAAAAAITLGYGAFYLGAVVLMRGWRARIRRANIVMAVAMIGLAGLWLTPVISPERIAVNSQMARFAAGEVATRLPLWEFAHDWGAPGRAALETLRAQAAQSPDLAAQLARLDRAGSRYDLTPPTEAQVDQARALREELRVLPAGAEVPEALYEAVARWSDDIGAGCARRTPAGNPGCVLVLAPFSGAAPQALVLWVRAYPGLGRAGFVERAGLWEAGETAVFGGAPELEEDAGAQIDAVIASGAGLVPSGIMALDLGGAKATILP